MTFLDSLNLEYFKDSEGEPTSSVLSTLEDFICYLDTSKGYSSGYLENSSNFNLDPNSINDLIDTLISALSAGDDVPQDTYRSYRDMNVFVSRIVDSKPNASKISMFNNFNSLLKSYNVFFNKMQHLRFNRYV